MKRTVPLFAVTCCLTVVIVFASRFAAQVTGDVNQDGAVNALDVQLTINAALGIDIGGRDADINTDGTVNALDVQQVINAALGITNGGELPPDPAEVAPEIDETVATNMFSATEFLYAGDPPIQTGVDPGTIEARRVAVLRGKVTDPAGDPLEGVLVTIHNHPELGQTLTREDGMFDMAVNGGGLLTVRYEKSGYLMVQRQRSTRWQDYLRLPDVALAPIDPNVTTIELNASTMQTLQGTGMTDADGTRRATVLVPPGTTAEMVFSDGSTQPIDALNVHVTEFTVGDNGPNAMPGELPPNVGYTYCVEFTVEEAETAGAAHIEFSQPLPFYLENFLGFPVGGVVPLGQYDPETVTWLPSDNGLVVEILGIQGGLAVLDLDGTGQAADGQALSELGVTEAEREQLAALYAPGQSLWRMPIPRFSPGWDANWGWGPPLDAVQLSLKIGAKLEAGLMSDNPDPCFTTGRSTIENQNQVLRETVGLTGTGFGLHYCSDRTPGRKAAYTLDIPVSYSDLPESLKRIELEIHIAGQLHTESFEPLPDQTHTFTWDGKDNLGRTLQGRHPVTVRVGYVYDGEYEAVPGGLGRAFGYNGRRVGLGVNSRGEFILWRTWDYSLGTWDARGHGLGGWTLGVHHAYDPVGRVLHPGYGGRRNANAISDFVVYTVAGGGDLASGEIGDGGPATEAKLYQPQGIEIAPDGSIYIADRRHHRIRLVDPERIITTVAGRGDWAGYSGDGGPATEAALNSPTGVALAPDGSFYIADRGNNRVRKVDPAGIITTVAGTGVVGYNGDDIPATEAQLNQPQSVAIGSDGSIYIADKLNYRIRRIDPAGIISTFAGTGVAGFSSGDGGPATEAVTSQITGVAVEADGSVLFADWGNNRIRRVGIDGIINTVAGGGSGYEDGSQATDVAISGIEGVGSGRDGSFYITTRWGYIHRVNPDGTIHVIAGLGTTTTEESLGGDGGPSVGSTFGMALDVAEGPEGSVYVTDWGNQRIRAIYRPLPGFDNEAITIPSEDGGLVYQFDAAGRHLRTQNALTGSTVYEFSYDENGLLISIADGDSNTTTIERDEDGTATTIVAPFGQRTELTVNDAGYLTEISDPLDHTYTSTYDSGGLLKTFTNPRGFSSQFAYDARGRLTRDEDAASGFVQLAREDDDTGYTITTTTAEGLITTYRTEAVDSGSVRNVVSSPCCGGETESVTWTDGSTHTTYANGTTVTHVGGPDPRFGMQAPVTTSVTVTTPGGRVLETTCSRTITLAETNNALSLQTATNFVTVNGRAFTNVFDASDNSITKTTPEGRQWVSYLDDRGRVTEMQTPGIESAFFHYDDHGRLDLTTLGSREVALAFDVDSGFLGGTTNALNLTTRIGRDETGRVLDVTLPDNKTWAYTRDPVGNVTRMTEPDGATEHDFEYSTVNRQTLYSSPLNAQERYVYDLDRRIVERRLPSGQSVEFIYDDRGWPITVRWPEGDKTLQYDDATGLLMQSLSRDGQQVDYSYDGTLMTGTAWSGVVTGGVAYSYDNELRVAEAAYAGLSLPVTFDNDGLITGYGEISFTRDPASGTLTGVTDGELGIGYTQNEFGEINSVTAQHDGVVYDASFTRDPLGRITRKIETVLGSARTWDYEYDTVGQVTRVLRDGVEVERFQYDDVGNRIGLVSTLADESLAADDFSYDADNRLLEAGARTFTYDNDGRLSQEVDDGQTTRYHYNTDGTLAGVYLPDGRQIAYLHDPRGRRIARDVDGVRTHAWLYGAGRMPLVEYDGAGAIRSVFVYANAQTPFLVVKGGVTYRIVADHLGSPRIVLDSDGNPVRELLYDSFGTVLSDSNPGFEIPFGFAGGMIDPDHALVRFGARDYHPPLGRWTAKDPILLSGGLNVYTYSGNDPVNRVDPSGLQEACPREDSIRALFYVTAAEVGAPVLDELEREHKLFAHKLATGDRNNRSLLARNLQVYMELVDQVKFIQPGIEKQVAQLMADDAAADSFFTRYAEILSEFANAPDSVGIDMNGLNTSLDTKVVKDISAYHRQRFNEALRTADPVKRRLLIRKAVVQFDRLFEQLNRGAQALTPSNTNLY